MVAGMSGPLPICPCGAIRQLIEYVHTLFRKTGNHSDGAENREHCRPLWRSPFAYSIRAYQSPLKNRNGERLFLFQEVTWTYRSDRRNVRLAAGGAGSVKLFLSARNRSSFASRAFYPEATAGRGPASVPIQERQRASAGAAGRNCSKIRRDISGSDRIEIYEAS